MLGTLQRILAQGRELWGKVPAVVKYSLLVGAIFVPLYFALAAPIRIGQADPDFIALPGQPFHQKDANAVVAKLNELKVPFKLGGLDGSTILVPAGQQMQARMALAQAGVPLQPAGFELFERSNLTQTDFDRKVQLLRAMQGELSRHIMSLAWVRNAAVQIGIPERSVFVREQKPVKAAVMVEPRQGAEVNPREVEGIVRFVAASVPELDPDHVTVIDNSGRILAQGLNQQTAQQQQNAEAADHLKRELEYQKMLEARLQGMLERTFGPGNASAMVSVKLAFDSRQEERTTFQGATPDGKGFLVSEQTTARAFAGQGSPDGTRPQGMDANSPNPPVYQSAAGQPAAQSSLDEHTRTANYELNRTKTTQITPPGRVESISVGVFVNSQVLKNVTPADQEAIRSAVANATGARKEDVTVAPLVFTNDLLNAFKPKAEEPAPAAAINWQYVAVGAALLAGGVLLGLAVVTWRRRQQPVLGPVPALAGSLAAGAGGPSLEGPGMDVEQLAAAQAEAFVPPPATVPPGTGEVAAAASADVDLTQLLGEEFAQKAQPDPLRQKLREEIEKMIRQHPEEVAQLIRAWISEER